MVTIATLLVWVPSLAWYRKLSTPVKPGVDVYVKPPSPLRSGVSVPCRTPASTAAVSVGAQGASAAGGREVGRRGVASPRHEGGGVRRGAGVGFVVCAAAESGADRVQARRPGGAQHDARRLPAPTHRHGPADGVAV